MRAIFKYHLLVVVTLAGCLYISGCNKNKEQPEPNPAQEPLEATLYGSSNFKWNSQGRFLTITTAATWTVGFSYPENAPAGWCSVSPSAGAGNKNVWIATATNNNDEARNATVIVATATGNVSIDIVQYGINAALPITLSNHLELPKIEDPEWLLDYEDGDFMLEYATAKKHPKWVAWPLYKSHMGSSGRTDAWQFDPRIPEEYRPKARTQTVPVQNGDFSGYDRGHLCPSADRTQSVAMNRQTFMYSNMSPQIGAFNQGIWETLEGKVRGWAGGLDTLYICAGGTILKESDIMAYTSPSRMAVPKYYFKVILRKKAATGAYDAIGFWFEHKDYGSEKLSSKHVKTIDDIEILTGIDFFYQLPEVEQNRVEAAFTLSSWGI
jgi:endonuclease G